MPVFIRLTLEGQDLYGTGVNLRFSAFTCGKQLRKKDESPS
jgi:hypothetical protein